MQKATINKDAKTKFTTSHRKEGKCFFDSYSMVVPSQYNKRSGFAVVELRLYGTGNTNTACIWVRGENFQCQGSGSAGGYGYHRPSQAAQIAIDNAGITISESIGGVGETAIEQAVIAIADALGYTEAILVHAHQ